MTKTQLVVGAIILASFAAGRFSAPVKTVTETKIVEVEKKTEKTDVKTHKETTSVETAKPDGSKQTTTTVIEDTGAHNASNSIDTVAAGEKKTEIKSGYNPTLSAMVGYDVLSGACVVGGSMTASVLGPLTLGVWGLNNSTAGLSVGLRF